MIPQGQTHLKIVLSPDQFRGLLGLITNLKMTPLVR